MDDVVHGPCIRDWNPRVNTTNGRPDFGQERVRFTGCPHDEEKRAEAEVLGSNQNLRPPVGMNIIEASLIDDADDRKRPVTLPDRRAESIACWKETPGKTELEENSGILTLVNADGATTEQRIPPAASDYRAYYANIRDALLGTAAPAVTTQHALNVMRILELARESSVRRCTIPWPG